jgi:hypothetical protein
MPRRSVVQSSARRYIIVSLVPFLRRFFVPDLRVTNAFFYSCF